MEIFKKSRKI